LAAACRQQLETQSARLAPDLWTASVGDGTRAESEVDNWTEARQPEVTSCMEAGESEVRSCVETGEDSGLAALLWAGLLESEYLLVSHMSHLFATLVALVCHTCYTC
jgi:hypothetical protein